MADYEEAVEKLREVLHRPKNDVPLYSNIETGKDEVFERFRPIFSAEKIAELTEGEMKAFLLFENNMHWTGLQRQGGRICSNMDKLKKHLGELLDESKSLTQRLDRTVDNIHGMGKAIVTAILLIAFPDKYGVWNAVSENGLKALDIWPDFSRGTTFGEKYEKINDLLNELARDLSIDLWTLDSLFWCLDYFTSGEIVYEEPTVAEDEGMDYGASTYKSGAQFGMERHLHEFLRDNWVKTELGQEWVLYTEQGDPDAGYEYPCGVGRIDLLAKHKNHPRWLVVELKKKQTGDATVGQITRYMGWVKNNMAMPDEKVEGIIIAPSGDNKIGYSLSVVQNVRLMKYEVQFRLLPVEGVS